MNQHSFRRLLMTACSAILLCLTLSGFSRASAAEKNLSNLRILIVGNSLSIDCNIAICYGQSVVDIAQGVQAAIISAVESMTGVKVTKVNVNVCGIVRK